MYNPQSQKEEKMWQMYFKLQKQNDFLMQQNKQQAQKIYADQNFIAQLTSHGQELEQNYANLYQIYQDKEEALKSALKQESSSQKFANLECQYLKVIESLKKENQILSEQLVNQRCSVTPQIQDLPVLQNQLQGLQSDLSSQNLRCEQLQKLNEQMQIQLADTKQQIEKLQDQNFILLQDLNKQATFNDLSALTAEQICIFQNKLELQKQKLKMTTLDDILDTAASIVKFDFPFLNQIDCLNIKLTQIEQIISNIVLYKQQDTKLNFLDSSDNIEPEPLQQLKLAPAERQISQSVQIEDELTDEYKLAITTSIKNQDKAEPNNSNHYQTQTFYDHGLADVIKQQAMINVQKNKLCSAAPVNQISINQYQNANQQNVTNKIQSPEQPRTPQLDDVPHKQLSPQRDQQIGKQLNFEESSEEYEEEESSESAQQGRRPTVEFSPQVPVSIAQKTLTQNYAKLAPKKTSQQMNLSDLQSSGTNIPIQAPPQSVKFQQPAPQNLKKETHFTSQFNNANFDALNEFVTQKEVFDSNSFKTVPKDDIFMTPVLKKEPKQEKQTESNLQNEFVKQYTRGQPNQVQQIFKETEIKQQINKIENQVANQETTERSQLTHQLLNLVKQSIFEDSILTEGDQSIIESIIVNSPNRDEFGNTIMSETNYSKNDSVWSPLQSLRK
ncbi:Hypothetical_protein [Hexamita inflata]|uniref:Hypothetical_protein n=1 Tax=Hexamita inflata TaxID=28002 RepID=A0AA86UC07_9EUKA|nr:Hypothetical protein HINF_LOCUS37304 [Hexamita inflata]